MLGLDDFVLGSIGGSLVSGLLNNSAASDRQDAAQTFSAQQYATRYQTTVKDMEAAGLNPMLAYSQMGGPSPSGVVSSPGGYGDVGHTAMQARMNSAQVANVNADTANKEASAELIQSQIAQNYASADQSRANVALMGEQANKIIAEVKNIPTAGRQMEATINMLAAQAFSLQQKGESEAYIRSNLTALTNKIFAELPVLRSQEMLNRANTALAYATRGLRSVEAEHEGVKIGETQTRKDLNQLDIDAAHALDNVGRGAKQVKPVFDVLRNILRR